MRAPFILLQGNERNSLRKIRAEYASEDAEDAAAEAAWRDFMLDPSAPAQPEQLGVWHEDELGSWQMLECDDEDDWGVDALTMGPDEDDVPFEMATDGKGSDPETGTPLPRSAQLALPECAGSEQRASFEHRRNKGELAGPASPSARWRRRQRAAALEAELAEYLPPGAARRLGRTFARRADGREDERPAHPSATGRGVHRAGLRVASGARAGLKLLAPRDAATRPMMARVRGAAFDMLLSLAAGTSPEALPPRARWLDLFAGTGAVGIEALSRGAARVEFVEADPWTAKTVLRANLGAAGAQPGTTLVHVARVEEFLQRPAPRSPFDFVSVCPPYDAVDYAHIFDLLEASGLLHQVGESGHAFGANAFRVGSAPFGEGRSQDVHPCFTASWSRTHRRKRLCWWSTPGSCRESSLTAWGP